MLVCLRGQHVVLREFVPNDWSAVLSYSCRPEVYRFQPWGPITPEEAREYTKRTIFQAQNQPRQNYTLAINLHTSSESIGACGLIINSPKLKTAELAFFLHPDHWGRGYATEAAGLLLDFGFKTLHLHRITGTCDPRNTGSARVLEKVGMRLEGRLRENIQLRDGWRDSLLYGKLETD